MDLRTSQLSFVKTIETTEKFVIDFPEGGRRGQAFVAAAFDLAGHDVRSIRVNDPSRNMPGDVAIVRATEPVIAIEVRQKQVSFADTMHFAESLRQGAVPLGLIAMLSPDQARLDDVAVQVQAESDFGVALDCVYGVRQLLVTAFAWSGAPLESSLESFPKLFLYRLREIEVADATIVEWADLFE